MVTGELCPQVLAADGGPGDNVTGRGYTWRFGDVQLIHLTADCKSVFLPPKCLISQNTISVLLVFPSPILFSALRLFS